MEGSTNYDINFFKPRTAFLKENVRIITIGLVIWAVCVFGFHILMKIIETRTPEPGYVVYEQVYPKLKDGSATVEEKAQIAKVYLGLVGKSIALQKSEPLKKAFSSTVYDILPAGEKETFLAATTQLETDKTVNLDYVAKALGIENDVVLKGVVPYATAPVTAGVTATAAEEIPAIMDKYLIHYQSVLTDTIFLGFPFHYFYSALFLLTLFVVICLVYCWVIDGVMKKHGMETDVE